MPLFKCEHVGDIDHEHFFVQKVKFSLRLIPSFETLRRHSDGFVLTWIVTSFTQTRGVQASLSAYCC